MIKLKGIVVVMVEENEIFFPRERVGIFGKGEKGLEEMIRRIKIHLLKIKYHLGMGFSCICLFLFSLLDMCIM